MSVFRFKRFEVANDRSAMKVNTDGVLLGALMSISSSDRVLLDIGTGTGTIALMAAQRLSDIAGDNEAVSIHAIDIDEPSASEAEVNFANSPWGANLKAHHLSLDAFAGHNNDTFDLIFSNPPYFDNALQAPEERRNTARHTSTGLSYREIFEFASSRLTEEGRVTLVLPSDTEYELTRCARMNGLHLNRITRIRTVPRKSPNRIVAEFSRKRMDSPEEMLLTIQNEGQYTQEYLSLTKDFYLFA
jgi:tRNA1Val (adenine37-N6)-methyltransferase